MPIANEVLKMAYKNKSSKFSKRIQSTISQTQSISRFVLVASLLLLSKILVIFFSKNKFISRISQKLKNKAEKLDIERAGIVSRIDIVEIALANLSSKKSRTYITIGGVVVGITTVVLLVSIGYGLQRLVVTRVARLDEMKQVDVYTQSGSKLKITDKTLSDIKAIEGVQSVLPLISVVGRVSYLKSVSDVAVFGVTSDYLRSSAVQPTKGRIFETNALTVSSTVISPKIQTINLDTSATPKSSEVAEVPTNTPMNSSSQPTSSIVAVRDGWVEIASVSAIKDSLQIDEVSLSEQALREAIVNKAMLNVLGLKDSEAVGKLITVSFVVTGNLLEDYQKRIESTPVQYKIVGVTPDQRSAQFYVPFIDVRSLGIGNYSQAKIVVKNANDLVKIRRQIEGLGFKTRSVVDTVNQINQLFGTLRAFLAILGLVALFVAAVGMFNTLTVSLMERTREVGLMKAMGMRSSEIKELFLAESLIMSAAGGFIGIVLGVFIGKIIEIVISMFAIFRGAGYLSLTYTPPLFAFGIILLALLVGLITGYYPSRRATKISALDALRYE